MIIEKPYTKEIEALSKELNTETQKGLSAQEASERLTKDGPNEIEAEKQQSLFLVFLLQFKSPMVLLLIAAAVLSFIFEEWLDGIAIIVVIFINAAIGFYMEFQANRSMEALKHMTSIPAKVIRDNKLQEVPSENVVTGDILYLEAGDMILADGRIFAAAQLEIDESALTGESIPVAKNDQIPAGEVALADQTNMLFKGTFVTKGNTKAIVTGVAMNTEMGKIASLVHTAKQAATPLEKKLEQFSKKLIWITVILVVLIFIAGLFRSDNIVELIEASIALAVAAIPEGLPIVATLALAQGMLKMAKYKVIVKKLAAVETLGGTSVICTDKTGTLTQNKIIVNTIITPAGKAEFLYEGDALKVDENIKKTLNYKLIQQAAVLCNTAHIEKKGKKDIEVGDPLEIGLLQFAQLDGVDTIKMRAEFIKVKEETFTSETKIMGTLNKSAEGQVLFGKGAVEEILKKCSTILINEKEENFTEESKKEWLDKSEALAGDGLRLLGFAHKSNPAEEDNFMHDLTFTGILGLLDPPRPEVPAAIKECKDAGIKVVMITGDHPATARNIGLKLGLIEENDSNVMIGKDMKEYATLTPEDKKMWMETKIFARVTPAQKLDLITLYQENKDVVGMTGDGVNDAPALKKADIGIAMGLRGTQVAQEVSSMVLKDDSFSSIVLAVKQGRVIFDNIQKFVIYLLSCNTSELLIIAIASLTNMHFSLFPLQILFINLVTDVLPALALGVSGGNPLVMKNKPRSSDEPIINKKQWISMFSYAFVITICVFGAVFFSHFILHKSENWNSELCNNIIFITLILCQLWHVFNMTPGYISIFKSEVVKNKYVWYALGTCLLILTISYVIPAMRTVLKIGNLSVIDWMVCLGFSMLSLLIIQLLKRLKIVL